MAEYISGSDRSRLTFWQFFRGLAKVVVGGALLLQALLFIILFSLILSAISGAQRSAENEKTPDLGIQPGAALIFNPSGVLVETAPAIDPFEEALAEAFGGSSVGEVSIHHLLRVLEKAQGDDDIQTLVLDLQNLFISDSALSKAELLADAVEDFRESGKKVVAVSSGYLQTQYMVASEAEEIVVDPQGYFFLTGFGSYGNYYKSLLDRLDVTSHVFRVGTYKSALEPYERDDMSDASKEARSLIVSQRWDTLTSRIDDNRGFSAGQTNAFAQGLSERLQAAGGDLSAALLDARMVDRLLDRPGRRAYLRELIGEKKGGDLNAVEFSEYDNTIKAPSNRPDVDDVAVVTVAGVIVDGNGSGDNAFADPIAEKLQAALEDDDVKAVVLRIDSPGGSLTASEVIRDEVLELQKAGKPVVASMSSIAASGGYWVAAPADKIFANEMTLTGSIGVYIYLQTYEKLAARYGFFTDGVGTAPLSGLNAVPIGELPEAATEFFQYQVDHAYREFLELVAEGRDMPIAAVSEVAEGRVWNGVDAKRLGLIDEFGDLEAAAAHAAKLAGLESYDVTTPKAEKTQFELFLEGLMAKGETWGLFGKGDIAAAASPLNKSALEAAAEVITEELQFQSSFTSPTGLYVRCLACGDE